MANIEFQLEQPLRQRIADFKVDSDKMAELNTIIDEILEKARLEAEYRKTKPRLDSLGFQNGTKRLGASIDKARTSARTFANRMFTAICNCTKTMKTAMANRNSSMRTNSNS